MSEPNIPTTDDGGRPLVSDWHQAILDKKKATLDLLLKRAILEKPELSKQALRVFIKKSFPYMGANQVKDYSESLLAMIEVYLEKKKTDKIVVPNDDRRSAIPKES